MSREKMGVSACIFNGELIYIFGGYDNYFNDLNEIEKYCI